MIFDLYFFVIFKEIGKIIFVIGINFIGYEIGRLGC